MARTLGMSLAADSGSRLVSFDTRLKLVTDGMPRGQ